MLLYQQQRYAAATELLERLAGDAEALAEGTAVRVRRRPEVVIEVEAAGWWRR